MNHPWWGPQVGDDQHAVLNLVDDLAAGHLTRVGDGRSDAVDTARKALAEHGLWTLGAPEAGGGGGADPVTMLVALAQLGGYWPALAWASVQAHAAAEALSEPGESCAQLLAHLHSGGPVAVHAIDPDGGYRVQLAGGRLRGDLARVDAAGREPRLVLIMDGETTVVVPPDGVTFGPAVRRSGLDGALTVSCRIDAAVPDHAVRRGLRATRARTILEAGAAALAAGIATTAAQAALAYSLTRVQFGGPLSDLPTVRAALSAQATASRGALTTAVGADLDQPCEVAGALAPACELAIEVAASAVQSHGGYGYMAEYPVESLLRDAVSLRAASGAAGAGRRAARALVGQSPS